MKERHLVQHKEFKESSRGKWKDFAHGPVARTPHSQCRRPGTDPWAGNQIPYATTKSSHAAALDSACQTKTEGPMCHN